jgi:hypothetical protein
VWVCWPHDTGAPQARTRSTLGEHKAPAPGGRQRCGFAGRTKRGHRRHAHAAHWANIKHQHQTRDNPPATLAHGLRKSGTLLGIHLHSSSHHGQLGGQAAPGRGGRCGTGTAHAAATVPGAACLQHHLPNAARGTGKGQGGKGARGKGVSSGYGVRVRGTGTGFRVRGTGYGVRDGIVLERVELCGGAGGCVGRPSRRTSVPAPTGDTRECERAPGRSGCRTAEPGPASPPPQSRGGKKPGKGFGMSGN